MGSEDEDERAMRRLQTLEQAREKADWQRQRKIESVDWFEKLNKEAEKQNPIGT